MWSRWATRTSVFAAAAASSGSLLATVLTAGTPEASKPTFGTFAGASNDAAPSTPVTAYGGASGQLNSASVLNAVNFALGKADVKDASPEFTAKRLALRAAVLNEIAAEEAATIAKSQLAKAAPLSPGLVPNEFRPFQLEAVNDVSYNTKLYRFKLPKEYQSLGLTVASCLVTQAEIDGKSVIRPYTPVSSEKTLGHFDLLVKSYPEGVMSKYFAGLKVGDSVNMKGPFKKLEYKSNMKKAIGMVAGGTGIAPMYQVITKILSDPRDKTEVRLVFANETESDILLKTELDALATLYPNFKVYYTLSKPPAQWSGFTGFVSKSIIASVLPPPSDDNLIMVCGPPGMMSAISGPKTKDNQQGEVDGVLKDMGFSSEQVFKF